MKRRSLLLLLVLGLLLTAGALPRLGGEWLHTQAASQQPDPPATTGLRLLVSFDSEPGPAQEALVHALGGEVRHAFETSPTLAIELPEEAIMGLAGAPGLTRVALDRVVQISDAELDSSWGVRRIGAGAVHSRNKGRGVKVAVIDTGIDYTHPDLDDNYAGGYDFFNLDNDPWDEPGLLATQHGTHVAGIIGAEDNGVGVVGVAPEADLYALKALHELGFGYISDVACAVEWATGLECPAGQAGVKVDVINMSLGTYEASPELEAAVSAAEAAGVVVVAAAGNQRGGSDPGASCPVAIPAAYPSAIAVSATDQGDTIASFSCRGPQVELAAPGVAVLSTAWGSYVSYSGTSMAAPHVAGVAALLIAESVVDENGNGRVNDEVRARLQTTAEDLGVPGRDDLYGYGLLNADGSTLPRATPTITPTATITPPPSLTPTASLTPTPTPDCPDVDGDGLNDCAELVYATNPNNPDTDGDGCTDWQELGPDETLGGRRDPLNPWDFFNPSRDGLNRGDSILLVATHFYEDDGTPSYSIDYDRTYLGPNPWNLGPPNGTIRGPDILAALSSFYHDCA